MDRLESMQAFMAAVNAGSLSAAARTLRVPLSTLSRHVSELEQHLQTQLLKRTSRALELTETGRAYHAACRSILEQLAEAERNAAGEYSAPRGELVVTAPIAFGRLHLLPIVAEFLAAYPRIDVRLWLVDRVASLFDEPIDVALRIGDLPDSGLVGVRLGACSLVVCGSPAYLAEHGKPKKPADLSKHDCIAFTALSSPETWTFVARRRKLNVPIRARLVLNTADSAIDAARAGVGLVRVLSYQSKPSERAGHLVRVLRPFEPEPTPVHLVYARQSLVPGKVRAFVDFATPRLKTTLMEIASG